LKCSRLIYCTEQIGLPSFSSPVYGAGGKDGWCGLSNARQFNMEQQTAALRQQAVCGTSALGSHTGAVSRSYQGGHAAKAEWLSVGFLITRERQQDRHGGTVPCCCWTLQGSLLCGLLLPSPSTHHQLQEQLSCSYSTTELLQFAIEDHPDLVPAYGSSQCCITSLQGPLPTRNTPGISPLTSKSWINVSSASNLYLWERENRESGDSQHTQVLLPLKLKSSSGTFKYSRSQSSVLSLSPLT